MQKNSNKELWSDVKMLFKKSDISIYKCKDFFISTLNKKPYKVEIDTKLAFAIKVKVQDRDVEIRVTKDGSGIILSITDPYGLIRVPSEKFKNFDKFKLFVMTRLSF